MYCHQDIKLDNMFRLYFSHHQVYTVKLQEVIQGECVRTGSHNVYNISYKELMEISTRTRL